MCIGDMMETQPAYMGDAMFDEWIKTLDALKELDFTTDLPGHGIAAFHDKSLITAYQSYLKDFMLPSDRASQAGTLARGARPRVDMTSHKGYFPQIQGPGVEIRVYGGCTSGWTITRTERNGVSTNWQGQRRSIGNPSGLPASFVIPRRRSTLRRWLAKVIQTEGHPYCLSNTWTFSTKPASGLPLAVIVKVFPPLETLNVVLSTCLPPFVNVDS